MGSEREPPHGLESATRPPRIEALDGLRFLAVSHVVIRHLGEASFVGLPAVLETIRSRANNMMPLFFVMSGFALTYVYGERLRSREVSTRWFWVSRALRLWPVYMVAVAIRFAADLAYGRGTPAQNAVGVALQSLALQAWVPPFVWYGNAPGWTVSVEVFLYLLYPWLVVQSFRMKPGALWLVATAAWIIGMLPCVLYVARFPDGYPVPDPPLSPWLDVVRYLPPLRLPAFVFGIAAARAFVTDKSAKKKRLGGLLTVAALVPISLVLLEDFHVEPRVRFLITLVGHVGLLTPAWALLLLGLSHGGPLSALLSARWLARLGAASYGLYILHFPVYDALAAFVPGLSVWNRSDLFLPEFFALMLPLCLLSFERVEEPLRRALLRRWFRS